jgi:hypothetical protein
MSAPPPQPGDLAAIAPSFRISLLLQPMSIVCWLDPIDFKNEELEDAHQPTPDTRSPQQLVPAMHAACSVGTGAG